MHARRRLPLLLPALFLGTIVWSGCGAMQWSAPTAEISTTYPHPALLVTGDIDGLSQVPFLPDGSDFGIVDCDLHLDAQWPAAYRSLAQHVTDRFAEGNFVTEAIVVTADGHAPVLMAE